MSLIELLASERFTMLRVQSLSFSQWDVGSPGEVRGTGFIQSCAYGLNVCYTDLVEQMFWVHSLETICTFLPAITNLLDEEGLWTVDSVSDSSQLESLSNPFD